MEQPLSEESYQAMRARIFAGTDEKAKRMVLVMEMVSKRIIKSLEEKKD